MSTQVLNQPNSKKKMVPKGKRLKWTPLAEVVSVSLAKHVIVGKVVVARENANSSENIKKLNFLIP